MGLRDSDELYFSLVCCNKAVLFHYIYMLYIELDRPYSWIKHLFTVVQHYNNVVQHYFPC